MIKILLIEDDVLWRTEILMQLDLLGYANVDYCKNLEDAKAYLLIQTPDIIVSDIQLGDNDIFEIFITNPNYLKIPFVFITVSENINFYELSKQVQNAIYLVKPFHRNSLKAAIENLEKHHQPESNNTVIKKGIIVRGSYSEKIFLEPQQIVYIKSELAYCIIKTPKNQFVVKNNMKNICLELGEDIMQIHRAFAVNKNFITKIEFNKKCVVTQFGEHPIGRFYKQDVIKHLNAIRVI